VIVYGCCVGSWEKFNQYVAPWTGGRPTFTKHGYPGIVRAYNEVLDTVQYHADLEALVLVHDDLELLDLDGEAKLLAPLRNPDVAMVGVAGGGGESIYWWNHSPVGHQRTDRRLIDFGQREGDVTLLEGSIMVLSPWLVQNLRFDPRFAWFHGYDEIGMQVRAAGKRAVVVDVDTWHHNLEGYSSEESAAKCREAAELYRQKWSLA
jgi:hypothetical protein